MQRALETRAGREGVDQRQRKCGDLDLQVARYGIERSPEPDPARADAQAGGIDRDAGARHDDLGRCVQPHRDVEIAPGEPGQAHADFLGHQLDLRREIGAQLRTRALQGDVEAAHPIALCGCLERREPAGSPQAGRLESKVGRGAAGRIVDMPLEVE